MTRVKRKNEKGSHLITIDHKSKLGSEEFRTIRSSLNFSSINKELKTIVVSSPSAGDGKTMTASNLAIVLRQEGKRVLLVDADLRSPSVHHTFDILNNSGLSHYLLGRVKMEDIVVRSFLTGVDIIPSGVIPPNPSEMLGSVQMTEFIEMVKEKYDVVIFDTPPILLVTDAAIIANQCDGVLLVVRHKKSDIAQIKKIKEKLKQADANLIGAILNGPKVRKKDYYY